MLSLFAPQRRSSLPVIQADLAAQLADLQELGLCLVDTGGQAGGGVLGGGEEVVVHVAKEFTVVVDAIAAVAVFCCSCLNVIYYMLL